MQHSAKTHHRYNNLTDEQVDFISKMSFPSVMEITQASEFDTPFVQTKSDRWEYVRLGREHEEIFNLDEYSNKLLKLISIKYTESHMAPLGTVRFNILKKLLRESDSLSFSVLKQSLEVLAKRGKAMDFFILKSATRTLIRLGFPGFDCDDEEELVRVAVPNVADPFLRYQEVEDIMPTHFKSLIANRLVEYTHFIWV